MSEPLTEERLLEIEAEVANMPRMVTVVTHDDAGDAFVRFGNLAATAYIPDLIAEVRRLRSFVNLIAQAPPPHDARASFYMATQLARRTLDPNYPDPLRRPTPPLSPTPDPLP